jgi:hypothetical protein
VVVAWRDVALHVGALVCGSWVVVAPAGESFQGVKRGVGGSGPACCLGAL